MITVFRAGGQLVKVRALMVLSLICAVACLWWGAHLAQTYGLSPADGGRLAPLATRLAVGVGVASLGIVFAAGMWLYGRCYVARMEVDGRSGGLHVHTVGFFGTREHVFDAAQVSVGERHEGTLDASLLGAPSVNAPWTSVRIRRRRLPLIVDEQGEFPQGKLLEGPIGPGRHA